MRHDLAFLHTSPVHVATFERLMKEAAPGIRVRHVVDEALLADAQKVGARDPALVARIEAAMRDAASTGAPVVVCTCSTIGGAAEHMQAGGGFAPARIDRAMADRAVSLGPRILVAAALESTIAPTLDLIHESATRLNAAVRLQTLFVPGAWARFLAGDTAGYVGEISASVRAAAADADVVVLAQASMAPAAAALGDLGVEVLSSPLLGVQRAIERLGK